MSDTASESDSITHIDDVHALLAVLTQDEFNSLVNAATYIGTQRDGELSGTPTSILSRCHVEVGSDGSFGMYTDNGNQRIEIAIGIQPRSNGAYKNGPDGNAVISSYQDPALCPIGVTIEKTESGQLVKNAMLDGKEWRCLIWKNNFEPKKERSWEWSISGPPATEESRAWATVVFRSIETKFKETAKNEGIQFQPNTSGPADQMFLFARRSVLVTNATPLDEGRGSEYPDPYNILTAIGPDRDFKFNRLPEVLVTDHKEETDVPMSFHDLHLLGKNIALQVFVTPRAYKHRGKLSWDFRLICVKVLGKKEASLAVSPSKAVLKRKAVYIGNIESTAKKQKASGSSLESSST